MSTNQYFISSLNIDFIIFHIFILFLLYFIDILNIKI